MENKENYDLKNLNILDSTTTVKVLTDFISNYDVIQVLIDHNITFYMYVRGDIYNIEKDEVLTKFKECNYSFSKLNNMLNGEYCIIILKYDNLKLRHVYMSVDYGGVNSVYYFLKDNNVYILSKERESNPLQEKETDNQVLIEGGELREIKIEENVIKAEIFIIYKPDINLKAFLSRNIYGDEVREKAKEVVKNAIKRRCKGMSKVGILKEEIEEGLIDESIKRMINEIGVEIDEINELTDVKNSFSGCRDWVPSQGRVAPEQRSCDSPAPASKVGIISMKGRKEIEMKNIDDISTLDRIGNHSRKSMMSVHMNNMREIDGITLRLKKKGWLSGGSVSRLCLGFSGSRLVSYPFLDREVIEFYKSLHPKIKLNNNLII